MGYGLIAINLRTTLLYISKYASLLRLIVQAKERQWMQIILHHSIHQQEDLKANPEYHHPPLPAS